jgi:hypothetical protein
MSKSIFICSHTSIKSSAWNPDTALELMCSKLAISSSYGLSGEGMHYFCDFRVNFVRRILAILIPVS